MPVINRTGRATQAPAINATSKPLDASKLDGKLVLVKQGKSATIELPPGKWEVKGENGRYSPQASRSITVRADGDAPAAMSFRNTKTKDVISFTVGVEGKPTGRAGGWIGGRDSSGSSVRGGGRTSGRTSSPGGGGGRTSGRGSAAPARTGGWKPASRGGGGATSGGRASTAGRGGRTSGGAGSGGWRPSRGGGSGGSGGGGFGVGGGGS